MADLNHYVEASQNIKSSTRKVWFLLSDQLQTWTTMWRHFKILNLPQGKPGFSYLTSGRLEPLCADDRHLKILNLPQGKSGFSYLTSGRLEPLCESSQNIKSSTRKVWFLLSDQWQTWTTIQSHLKRDPYPYTWVLITFLHSKICFSVQKQLFTSIPFTLPSWNSLLKRCNPPLHYPIPSHPPNPISHSSYPTHISIKWEWCLKMV